MGINDRRVLLSYPVARSCRVGAYIGVMSFSRPDPLHVRDTLVDTCWIIKRYHLTSLFIFSSPPHLYVCATGIYCVQGLDRLTEAQQEEVHKVCSIIPDVDVKVDIFVEDEGEIAENDLVTIKVSPDTSSTKKE